MKHILPLIAFCTSLFFAGCERNESDTKTLTLFVAASLTDVVQEVGAEFEKEHSVKMTYNFTGSGALAQQLLASPRADLYLSASQRWMNEVEQAGRIKDGTRRTLLSNNLVVIGNRNSTWELTHPSKLAELPFRFLAIGDPESVPAGKYAKSWLESVTLEGGSTLWDEVQGRISPAPDVRAALGQVAGSADVAGIVYGTDFTSSQGKVRAIYEVPVEDGPKIEYPVAILAETPEPVLALAFLEFLSSSKARELFEHHGFILEE